MGVSALTVAARQDSEQTSKDQKRASKQKKQSDSALYKELDTPYKKWLDEDVAYIITPEERDTFLHLQTNEERETFIEAFWQRRNPDPDSPDNSYKDEIYRRIAYANEHFASGIPGWKTDRGRIYITWGAPDERDEHTAGEQWDRPMDQGGGTTTTYAYENWRYRYLAGYNGDHQENVEFEFVDPTGTGEFHLTMDPSEKDALLNVPGAGLTMPEQMGMADKSMRFSNPDGTHLAGQGEGVAQGSELNEFSRLENYAAAFQPPPVKLPEELVTHNLVRNTLKFDYMEDFLRITSDTVLVPITVQIPRRQLLFVEKDGVDRAHADVFGRITTLTGRTITTFDDPVEVDAPASTLQATQAVQQIYQKQVPLSPGLYALDLVIKDTNSGNVGVVDTRLAVPQFKEDEMNASSLILARQITPVSYKDIGLGQFVLGDVKVVPQMSRTFYQNEQMGIFLQVYNLKVDEKTNKPDVSVEYRVVKDKDPNPVLKFDLGADKLPAHGEEMTLQDALTLGSLAPGQYKLEVAITDNLAKQSITPAQNFTVVAAPANANTTQGR
ncbi:MAG TPA: GWxTD domain-containing protein [Candidatus Acidoferrales bacterium]|nr:GWxTD domain-containing protein [Candidatus Acidoferrales bacterium]